MRAQHAEHRILECYIYLCDAIYIHKWQRRDVKRGRERERGKRERGPSAADIQALFDKKEICAREQWQQRKMSIIISTNVLAFYFSSFHSISFFMLCLCPMSLSLRSKMWTPYPHKYKAQAHTNTCTLLCRVFISCSVWIVIRKWNKTTQKQQNAKRENESRR